jgi:hypothetical protein
VVVASICRAETPGKVNLEAAAVAAELIGAPVFAADGAKVARSMMKVNRTSCE